MKTNFLKLLSMPLILLLIILSPHLYYKIAYRVKILEYTQSDYGPIWVYETYKKRCLSFIQPLGNNQSCIISQQPNILDFDYYKAIFAALYLNPKPDKILMIGLGGGVMAKALLSLLPHCKIDIAEINPKVLYLAEKYFAFQQNANMRVTIIDGFDFVKKASENQSKYDLIIIDAFTADYVPEAFLTNEFVAMIKNILNPEGVISVNTFTRSQWYDKESMLYSASFGMILNVITDGNRVILAKNNGLPAADQIAKAADLWDAAFQNLGITKQWLLPKMSH